VRAVSLNHQIIGSKQPLLIHGGRLRFNLSLFQTPLTWEPAALGLPCSCPYFVMISHMHGCFSLCDFKLIFPFCRGYQRSMVKSMSLAAKVPHFHYLEEINCDSLVQLKTTFQNENKDQTIKHTFLPFLIKSLSMALSKYPMLNSSFIEETNEVVFKGMQSLSFSFRSCFLLSQKRIQKTV
jgi:hypothetical protein